MVCTLKIGDPILLNPGTHRFTAILNSLKTNISARLKKFYDKPNNAEFTFDLVWFIGWLVGFYGISTFVGYLTPNQF